MCQGKVKPTVPEVLPLVQSLYRKHSAGCCWHVVLDDGNTEKVFVEVSARNVTRWPCKHNEECNKLAKLLPLMSRTQLTKLVRDA